MADYYPLLARAIEGLDQNTAEQRRAVYERARAALVRQLRGYDPPLNESEITRERLALEDAIRRTEAEARSSQPLAASVPRRPADPPPAPVAKRPAPPPAAPPLAARPAPVPPPQRTEPHFGMESRREEAAQDYAPQTTAPSAPGPSPTVEAPILPPQPEQSSTDEDRYAWMRERFAVLAAVGVVFVLLAAGLTAYIKRDSLATMFGGHNATVAGSSSPASPPKSTDRVGSGDTGEATPQQTAPAAGQAAQQNPAQPASLVSQRALLYEEPPNKESVRTFNASAVWHAETISVQGRPEVQLRVDITVPERNMQVSMVIKRNTDSTLPASHTIDIQFLLPPNFDNTGVANVPGVLMKTAEDADGTALSGHSVRVMANTFLIGLSNVTAERTRNMSLLAEREWIDIPIMYENGRRAVLTMEKGTPGAQALKDALAAWNTAATSGEAASPATGATTTPQ